MIQQFHSWIYIQELRIGIQINICTQILITAVITIAKMLKQPKHHTDIDNSTNHNSQNVETTQTSITKWINKMQYIHTTKYYSIPKRNQD